MLGGPRKALQCTLPPGSQAWEAALCGAPGGRAIDPRGFLHHRWLTLTFPPCPTSTRSRPRGPSAARCAVGPSCRSRQPSTWRWSGRATGCCRPSTSPSKPTRCERPPPPSASLTARPTLRRGGACPPQEGSMHAGPSALAVRPFVQSSRCQEPPRHTPSRLSICAAQPPP